MSTINVKVPNGACIRRFNSTSIFTLPHGSTYVLWRFSLPNDRVEKNDDGFILCLDTDKLIQLFYRGKDCEVTAKELEREYNTYNDYDFKGPIITIPNELMHRQLDKMCCVHVPNDGDVWSVIIPNVWRNKETGDYQIPETFNLTASKLDGTCSTMISSIEFNNWITNYKKTEEEKTNHGNRE